MNKPRTRKQLVLDMIALNKKEAAMLEAALEHGAGQVARPKIVEGIRARIDGLTKSVEMLEGELE